MLPRYNYIDNTNAPTSPIQCHVTPISFSKRAKLTSLQSRQLPNASLATSPSMSSYIHFFPWQFTCKLQEHSTSHHGINRQTQEVTHKPNMQTPVPLSSWPGNYVAQKSQVALDSVPPVYSAGNNLCQASQDTFSGHCKTRITSCATPYANSMTLLRNIAVAALRDSHVYNYCRAYSLIPFLLLMETSFRA